MRLQVKGKNVEVNDSLRDYAELKFRKLEKQLHDLTRVELELAVEKNPSIAASHVAEATVFTKGPVLRARESASDPRASIDQLTEKLERQVVRYREKRRRRADRRNGAAPAAAPSNQHEEEPLIVKTKQFVFSSMTPEEAVEAMELVGHDFFVFRNDESAEVNVVYRRRDGTYGLIEPS
ncbi:MAG TPA: ribosome-associated translation inhibitor RaiA [Gaiellaceae bacterium]|nr:ribosome-associated translation inhibitor RaiA [Gaiellaceae bacterium]